MRKSALLLAVLFAASLTTVADAATKKKEAPKPDPAVAATENSMRFIRDMFCPFCIQKPAAAPAKKGKKA